MKMCVFIRTPMFPCLTGMCVCKRENARGYVYTGICVCTRTPVLSCLAGMCVYMRRCVWIGVYVLCKK